MLHPHWCFDIKSKALHLPDVHIDGTREAPADYWSSNNDERDICQQMS